MEDYRTKFRLKEIEILEKNRDILLLTKELNLSKEKISKIEHKIHHLKVYFNLCVLVVVALTIVLITELLKR